MQWYVRYENDGQILGPMSREEAHRLTELADAESPQCTAFSSEIFEQRVASSEEVSGVLRDLREMQENEKEVEHMLNAEVARRSIEVIESLSREIVIECRVAGGVFDVESEIPDHIRLVVHDEDIPAEDEDDDDDGTTLVFGKAF